MTFDRVVPLLLLILAASCGSDTVSGTSVEVAAHPVGPPAPGCTTACQVSGGQTFALFHAFVTVESVELLACDSGLQSFFRALAPIRQAWAHGVASPTSTAEPVVIDMLSGVATVSLGSMTPPAGSYCKVRVTLGPPDEDAEGLPTDPDVLGDTLFVSGASSSASLSIISPDARSTTLTLPSPIVLDEAHKTATLDVQVGASGWMAPLDTGAGTEANAAVLLQSLANSLAASGS